MFAAVDDEIYAVAMAAHSFQDRRVVRSDHNMDTSIGKNGANVFDRGHEQWQPAASRSQRLDFRLGKSLSFAGCQKNEMGMRLTHDDEARK